MFRRLTLATLVSLAAVNASIAEEVLPAGSVYGTSDGCAGVAANKHPEGDGWVVVTRKYMRQRESSCSFVQTIRDKDGSLFVNAICSGEGDTWPASFAIYAGEEGALRLSDTNNNPWDINVCEGVSDAVADKLFGE